MAAPADLDHVVADPAVEIAGIGDLHPVADVDFDDAFALFVDPLHPGMEDADADMRAGRRAGAKEQRQFIGMGEAGAPEPGQRYDRR